MSALALATHLHGIYALPNILFWLNAFFLIALIIVTGVRIMRYPAAFAADLHSHRRGVGFFTVIAAFGVFGTQLVLQTEAVGLAVFFWIVAAVLLPDSPEYKALLAGGFADYQLRIGGLVEHPQEVSFAELKAMPKQSQITTHFCIQGWSGVAKWTGVPMRHILELVRPTEEARYAVFYSMAFGDDGGRYYEVHPMNNLRHKLTLLAYEMNDEPLRVMHGAPLRLRCENELGFRMVKWLAAIEFVNDFADLGAGQGGYNDDHEFHGHRMPI